MLDTIASVLRKRCGLQSNSQIVVGVSGGADSLCLLHVLHTLGHRLLAAHLDHGLRPDSARDAELVVSVASEMGIPCATRTADVRALAREEGLSIEEGGRKARYQFLFEQARAVFADAVAVGHTADDQVETILMHLIRGAGLAGLRGMSPRSLLNEFEGKIPLVRPLLDVRRSETEAYCHQNGLRPATDSSNLSLEFFRNRVRHELVPLLESYNPRFREALWRTSKAIAADLSIVDDAVAQAWEHTVVESKSTMVAFNATTLAAQSSALRRRLLMHAIRKLSPQADMGFTNLDLAAELTSGSGSARMDLGSGLVITREPGAVYVSLDRESLPDQDWPQLMNQPVAVAPQPSTRIALAHGWEFSSRFEPVSEAAAGIGPRELDTFQACVDADALPKALHLRWPKPGDRLVPFGMGGHSQKLSDVFVNEKVPVRLRKRWPVLAADDTLVWVPGYRPAEAYKVRPETRHLAYFTVSRRETVNS